MQLILEENGITKVWVFTAYGSKFVLTIYSESHIPVGKRKRVTLNYWSSHCNSNSNLQSNIPEPRLPEHIKRMAKDQYFKQVEFMAFNQFTANK